MTENRRSKRVGSLIQEELSRFLIEDVQGQVPGLITVTRVEVTDDLMTAHVYLSVFGNGDKEAPPGPARKEERAHPKNPCLPGQFKV